MSYDLIETSPESGRPVELFEFNQGGTFYRFTSSDENIIYNGNVYRRIPIQRSSIEQTESFQKSGITVDISIKEEFAKSYLTYSPDSITVLTIYRRHLSDTDNEYIVYWKGTVSSANADGNQMRFECESVFSALRRSGLRAKYSRSCRHVLYDSNCRVNQEDFRFNATVDSVSGNNITFTLDIPDSEKLNDYFLAGMIETQTGAKRFINSQNNNVLTLSYAFNSLSAGDTVSLYAGCQHRVHIDCRDKFNNIENYGGFPYFPTDSGPFTGRSIA